MPQLPPNRIPELPSLIIAAAAINYDHNVAHVACNEILPLALEPVRNHLTRWSSRPGENGVQWYEWCQLKMVEISSGKNIPVHSKQDRIFRPTGNINVGWTYFHCVEF